MPCSRNLTLSRSLGDPAQLTIGARFATGIFTHFARPTRATTHHCWRLSGASVGAKYEKGGRVHFRGLPAGSCEVCPAIHRPGVSRSSLPFPGYDTRCFIAREARLALCQYFKSLTLTVPLAPGDPKDYSPLQAADLWAYELGAYWHHKNRWAFGEILQNALKMPGGHRFFQLCDKKFMLGALGELDETE